MLPLLGWAVAALMMLAACDTVSALPPAIARLAALLPESGDWAQQSARVRNVLQLVLQDIDSGSALGGLPGALLNGTQLQIVYGDSGPVPVTALRALRQIVSTYNDSLYGVYGSLANDVTYALDTHASLLSLSVVSPAADAISLADRGDHPYFWRPNADGTTLAQFLILVRTRTYHKHCTG